MEIHKEPTLDKKFHHVKAQLYSRKQISKNESPWMHACMIADHTQVASSQ